MRLSVRETCPARAMEAIALDRPLWKMVTMGTPELTSGIMPDDMRCFVVRDLQKRLLGWYFLHPVDDSWQIHMATPSIYWGQELTHLASTAILDATLYMGMRPLLADMPPQAKHARQHAQEHGFEPLEGNLFMLEH